jgi:hypothetical protein
MIICMRSTIVIDDALFKRVRRRAAELGVTISDVVSDALREALARRSEEPPPLRLPTFGDPKQRVHHEPADLTAAEDEDDRRRVRG